MGGWMLGWGWGDLSDPRNPLLAVTWVVNSLHKTEVYLVKILFLNTPVIPAAHSMSSLK